MPLISEMRTTWRASCGNRLGVNSGRAAGGLSVYTGPAQRGRNTVSRRGDTAADMASVRVPEHPEVCETAFPASEISVLFKTHEHTPGQDQRKLKASGHQVLRTGLRTSQVFWTPWTPVPGTCPGSLGTEGESRDEPSSLEIVN